MLKMEIIQNEEQVEELNLKVKEALADVYSKQMVLELERTHWEEERQQMDEERDAVRVERTVAQ